MESSFCLMDLQFFIESWRRQGASRPTMAFRPTSPMFQHPFRSSSSMNLIFLLMNKNWKSSALMLIARVSLSLLRCRSAGN